MQPDFLEFKNIKNIKKIHAIIHREHNIKQIVK